MLIYKSDENDDMMKFSHSYTLFKHIYLRVRGEVSSPKKKKKVFINYIFRIKIVININITTTTRNALSLLGGR